MGKKEKKSSIKKKGKYLLINANTTLEELLDYVELPDQLKKVLRNDITWQQRQETSLSRSILSPTLDARWLASLLAISTKVNTKEDDSILLSDFLRSKTSTSQLLGLLIPFDLTDVSISESKVGLTPADKPIVSAVCAVTTKNDLIKNATIALTGVWTKDKARVSKASVLLISKPINEKSLDNVVKEVVNEVSPKGDFRGSEEYRRAMAGVVTRRALEKCLLGVNHK